MVHSIVPFILKLGLPGLFILSMLDSTPVFYLPFAIDAIYILHVAHHNHGMLTNFVFTVTGSIAGCLITYWFVSKMSIDAIERHIPRLKIDQIRERVSRHAFWAVLIAALLPPPFPFTPFILAISSIKLPLRTFLPAIVCGRSIRFFIEGVLALHYGRHIVRLIKNPIWEAIVALILVVAVVGTIVSIIRWTRRPTAKIAEI